MYTEAILRRSQLEAASSLWVWMRTLRIADVFDLRECIDTEALA